MENQKKSVMVNASYDMDNGEFISSVLRKLLAKVCPFLHVDSAYMAPYITEAMTEIVVNTKWMHDLSGTDWQDSPEGQAIHALVRGGMLKATEVDKDMDDLDRVAGSVVSKILEHI